MQVQKWRGWALKSNILMLKICITYFPQFFLILASHFTTLLFCHFGINDSKWLNNWRESLRISFMISKLLEWQDVHSKIHQSRRVIKLIPRSIRRVSGYLTYLLLFSKYFMGRQVYHSFTFSKHTEAI